MTPFFKIIEYFSKICWKTQIGIACRTHFFQNNRIFQQNLLKKSNWDCLQDPFLFFFFQIIEYFSKNLFDYQWQNLQ
jgi:hypothetical protein